VSAGTATEPVVVASRYRLLRPIGHGGVGVVWRAEDQLLERHVAVKEVRLGSEAEAVRAETLHEARAVAQLNNPHVVTVYDVLEAQGRPWIVMELVPGRSLDRVIHEEGALAPPRAAAIGLQVLDALRCAHEHSLLHRDVKPSNVLVTPDERALLTDFGIAHRDGDSPVTPPGFLRGAPGYLAPERVRGDPAQPASDLWALAATLCTALAGRGPHDRGEALPTMTAIVHDPPDGLDRTGPLRPLLTGMLTKDPARRPTQDAVDAALRDVAERSEFEPLQTPADETTPVARGRGVGASRSHRRATAALAGVSAAAVTALAGFAMLPGDPPPGAASAPPPSPAAPPAARHGGPPVTSAVRPLSYPSETTEQPAPPPSAPDAAGAPNIAPETGAAGAGQPATAAPPPPSTAAPSTSEAPSSTGEPPPPTNQENPSASGGRSSTGGTGDSPSSGGSSSGGSASGGSASGGSASGGSGGASPTGSSSSP
jgi:eukaryotic-like serine/threonine-protein kinase